MILSYYSEYGTSAQVNFKISLVNRQVSKALGLEFEAFRLGLKEE
jgi:hypothetical protein